MRIFVCVKIKCTQGGMVMKKSLTVTLASAMTASLAAHGGSGNAETLELTTTAKALGTETQAGGTEAKNGQEGTEVVSSNAEAISNVILCSSMQEDQLMAIK